MATDVVMPQMGESIAEGTIVRWIKKVGDPVERDEPLLEISTDKVDAEIPSPVAGTVVAIRANEGDTVPVHSVVAVIDESSTAPHETAQPAPATATEDVGPAAGPTPTPSSSSPERRGVPSTEATGPASFEETARQRSSPLVRRMASEYNIDISQIKGTGIAGRVTKEDILRFIGTSPAATAGRASATEQETRTPVQPARKDGGAGRIERVVPMSVMRKRIAEHMTASRRTSAHVHTVFEVNFSQVARIRNAKKAEYERAGAKLTYLSFIVKAATRALRAVPIVNASIDGDNIAYHDEVNVGIAVSLEWGLIVPVIRNADAKDLLGLSLVIADLANRARSKQLKPDEVAGGTFTITNPGGSGAVFGVPIINQPQVAILGVGSIEKRPVVVDDALAIRLTAYLSLGFDHRLIDGAVADEFMSSIKRELENWDASNA